MKYLFVFIINLVTINLSCAQELELIPEASTMKWTGKAAFNTYALSGTLLPKSSTLTVLKESIMSGEIVIDMKSLKAENKDLEQHLKSKDFFEVEKYSTAYFTFEQNMPLNVVDHNLSGKMSIRNIEQQVSIPITIDQTQNGMMISGKVSLDRTLFGIKFNSPNFYENLKDQAIADFFELEFSFQFRRK